MNFTTTYVLKRHIERRHAINVDEDGNTYIGKISKKVQCNVCDKWVIGLEAHKGRNHAEKVDIQCDHCGKTFKRNLDVKIHIDGVHLKLKNFHCHVVGCNKSFSVKSSFQRHIKIVHDKMKPYSCPDCDSLFSTGHQLKLHKERAHNKIRHNCTFAGCAKNYSDPSNLKRHVKNKHH